ncbi:7057_t:CDS:10 [Funneliformis geosporum]|uniref:7057_t:CDS:1 n=1 Tax=Funneliformis geosporum TaxID=1117311 RepID=A0A9W4SJJ4_9GLOM|nr:7057_t:CDS:10 [Funneliformis geosporum]
MSTASNAPGALSPNVNGDSRRFSSLSDSSLNDFLPTSLHLENIASTVTSTMSTTVSTTASMLFSPLTTRAVKGDTAYILSELAPQLMDQRRIQQFISNGSSRHTKENTKKIVSAEDISTSTTSQRPDDILLDSEIPESKAPLSLFQGYKATFQEVETQKKSKRKSKTHKRKVRGLLTDTFDAMSDTASVDSDHKPLNQLIADRDRVVRENNKIQMQESRTKADIKKTESEIAELTTKKLNLENNLAKYNKRQVELSSQLEDLNDKIANFNTENSYNERRTRTKGKGVERRSHEPGTCIKVLEGHDDMITCLDFDKPYGTLVTSSLDNTLRAWDLNNYRCFGALDGHKDLVKCLQIDGSHLVTGSRDKTIRQWDLSKLVSHPESVTNLSELSFASALIPETNGLTNVGDNCWITSLEGHNGSITCLHFENNSLVSGSSDKTMKHWDMETGQCVLTMDILWAMSCSNAERRQAGLLFDNFIFGGGDFIGALQFRHVGLASGTEDGAIRMWDLRTGQAHRTLLGHTGPITSLQFDDHHVVSGSIDKSIRIWDLRTGSVIDTFSYDNSITSLQFDSSKIISCAGHSQNSQCIKFKDSILLSGGQDKVIKLWAL